MNKCKQVRIYLLKQVQGRLECGKCVGGASTESEFACLYSSFCVFLPYRHVAASYNCSIDFS